MLQNKGQYMIQFRLVVLNNTRTYKTAMNKTVILIIPPKKVVINYS